MPTMNVSLTAELAEFVAAELRSGDYASSSEVVRDALRTLRRDRDHEAEKLEALRQTLAAGLSEAERHDLSDRGVAEIMAEVLAGDNG